MLHPPWVLQRLQACGASGRRRWCTCKPAVPAALCRPAFFFFFFSPSS